MKVKRLIVMSGLFFALSGVTVFASSLWGDYQGFEKIRVMVNNAEKQFSESDVPAIMVKGKAMVPVDALSESLHSLVKWEPSTQTVSVYKPNVSMFTALEVSKDYSIKQLFGKVKTGDILDFVVFAQVDNMKTSFYSFKISIESPSGKEVVEPHVKVIAGEKESFWYPWPFYKVNFAESGKYTIKFSIKPDENSDYTVIAEKTIVSQ